MSLPIYLDYAATTPVDARVLAKMLPYLQQQTAFGNPSSSHFYGREAAQAVNAARQQVAELLNAEPNEIIWTSGATEANNLALKGAAYALRNRGQHIITCLTEHSSVLDTCKYLETQGFTVTYLAPEVTGLIDLAKLAAAIQRDTILISIMHVNNETGVIQDIAAIAKLARTHHIIFHVDAVQSVGKLPINLKQLSIDLLSMSAHKLYGPKGVGALYVKSGVDLVAQIQGGGQEQGLRAGTLATQQIVAMGAAFALAQQEMSEEIPRIQQLRERLWHGMSDLGEVYLNGDDQARVAGILNVAFGRVDSNILLPTVKALAISTGSACHAPQRTASYVLQHMGINPELARNSMRFSLGRFTTVQEIDSAIVIIRKAIIHLRQI